ncbi:MAG: response regulator, partial [Magnetococcales bacterium]|nr:response regulator [Magnetococcales bacterium]
QILVNLSNNAIKFTQEGEILIRIILEQTENDTVLLRFSVTDSGIGMTEAQLNKLFESFCQADASIPRKYGGPGLGLSISSRLTQMMGGEIWAESSFGKGSTFYFTARFTISDQIDAERKPKILDHGGVSVLIVDDNGSAREILRQMAETLTLKVMQASSGVEALELVQRFNAVGAPFRIVFLDWRMPEMDGAEVCRRIKRNGILDPPPKVVMVSAHDRHDIMRSLGDCPADGYLVKPVTASNFLDTTMNVLGNEPRLGARKKSVDLWRDSVLPVAGSRILLVEDNEINQQVAKELLVMANMEVVMAENGQQAVDAVFSESFDLVLMDLQMPVMDGYTAARKIRQDGRFADLPIVAMTANALSGDREKCLEAGMNDHVAKPIHPPVLYTVLASWIRPREGLGLIQNDQRSVGNGSAVKLPDLPGIDVEAALSRVAGNASLYVDLLRQFASGQRNAADAIAIALQDGSKDLAERLVHTTKGVAGNIGAEAVRQAAAALEHAISHRHVDMVPHCLDHFRNDMRELMAMLEVALASVEVPHEDRVAVTSGPDDLREELIRMQALLADFDAKAVEIFREIRPQLLPLVPAQELADVERSLNEFSFDKALVRVKRMINGVETHIEDTRSPNLEHMIHHLTRLRDLLADFDGEASQAYLSIRPDLADWVSPEEILALDRALNEFSLDDALIVVERLLQQMNLA